MMKDVDCSGCGRLLGYTPNRNPGYIYCSHPCEEQPPISDNEDRDSLIVVLSRVKPQTWISKHTGISRQRVQQIIKLREV